MCTRLKLSTHFKNYYTVKLYCLNAYFKKDTALKSLPGNRRLYVSVVLTEEW